MVHAVKKKKFTPKKHKHKTYSCSCVNKGFLKEMRCGGICMMRRHNYILWEQQLAVVQLLELFRDQQLWSGAFRWKGTLSQKIVGLRPPLFSKPTFVGRNKAEWLIRLAFMMILILNICLLEPNHCTSTVKSLRELCKLPVPLSSSLWAWILFFASKIRKQEASSWLLC